MTSVLVVEDDDELRSAVARDLDHKGFSVVSVPDVDEALSQVHEASFDVVLTDLRIGQRDGIDLLMELSVQAPNARPILMSAYATARDHQRAVELGAVQVLCKPFTSNQLLTAIQQAVECERGFRGTVHGLSLIDMLQMFHYGRRSISLTIGGRVQGELHIRDGEVVHAKRGDLEGEAALREILAMPSGSVRTSALASSESTITRNFQSLLLDVLRELDEAERQSSVEDPFALNADWGRTTHPETPDLTAEDRVQVACRRLLENVDDAVSCAAVDLESHHLISQYDNSGMDPEASKSVALSTALLVSSEGLCRLNAELSGDSNERFAQELRIRSKYQQRFVCVVNEGKTAVVLVTGADISPGLGWAQFKAAVPIVERSLG